MKTKSLLVVSAVILASALLTIRSSQSATHSNDLFMANLEALTNSPETSKGAASVITKTSIQEVEGKNELGHLFRCKAYVTVITQCQGIGEIPCSVGAQSIGEPYDCNRIYETR